jgi:signal transduction histidine kinase
MAGEILASSIALTHLIDDMLDFSRLQQGSTTVQVEAVDLARVLHGAADAFRRVPGGDRLTLEISDTLPAWADPVRTSRIVDSLLINASRYARNGSITLRGTQQGAEVWIEVTGGWPSVWPEEHARVWRQFYQGPQPALTSDVHAMGLALTLVKALAEAQSGRVVFEGESTEGGIVRVILPSTEASASSILS